MLKALIENNIKNKKKTFALLIDPDKYNTEQFVATIENILPDVILVGGSLLFGDLNKTIINIKEKTNIPVYIFPGSSMQIAKEADGILFTSLISGRNSEFLIGNQVSAAPIIKKYKLDTLSTGYMLIASDNNTAVQYMSNTIPIPSDKNDIAVATALAGEMLGLQAIYLEAGSGASNSVPLEMISVVKKQLNIPIIVGGGIRSSKSIENIYNAGADVIVIGNAFENKDFKPEALKKTLDKFR